MMMMIMMVVVVVVVLVLVTMMITQPFYSDACECHRKPYPIPRSHFQRTNVTNEFFNHWLIF